MAQKEIVRDALKKYQTDMIPNYGYNALYYSDDQCVKKDGFAKYVNSHLSNNDDFNDIIAYYCVQYNDALSFLLGTNVLGFVFTDKRLYYIENNSQFVIKQWYYDELFCEGNNNSEYVFLSEFNVSLRRDFLRRVKNYMVQRYLIQFLRSISNGNVVVPDGKGDMTAENNNRRSSTENAENNTLTDDKVDSSAKESQKDIIKEALKQYQTDMIRHSGDRSFYFSNDSCVRNKAFAKVANNLLRTNDDIDNTIAYYEIWSQSMQDSFIINSTDDIILMYGSVFVFTDKRIYYIHGSYNFDKNNMGIDKWRYDEIIREGTSLDETDQYRFLANEGLLIDKAFYKHLYNFVPKYLVQFLRSVTKENDTSTGGKGNLMSETELYQKRLAGQNTVSLFQLCIKYNMSPAQIVSFLSSLGLPATEDPNFLVSSLLIPLLDMNFAKEMHKSADLDGAQNSTGEQNTAENTAPTKDGEWGVL